MKRRALVGRRALAYAKQTGRTPIEEMLRKAGGRE